MSSARSEDFQPVRSRDPGLTHDVQNVFSAKQATCSRLLDAIHSYCIGDQACPFGIRGVLSGDSARLRRPVIV